MLESQQDSHNSAAPNGGSHNRNGEPRIIFDGRVVTLAEMAAIADRLQNARFRDELLSGAAKYLIVRRGEPRPAEAPEMRLAPEALRNFHGPKRVNLNSRRVWR
jgi:hypothetical protein